MNEIKNKYDDILKRIDTNKPVIQSILDDIEDNVKQQEEQFKKKSKDLADDKEKWELEKEAIASSHTFESRIRLDVGGTKFTTTLCTLTRFPDSILGAMFSGRHKLTADDSGYDFIDRGSNISTDDNGYYFIDRDGTHFRHVLNFMRSPEDFDVSSMSTDHQKELKKEAAYYGLDSLMFPLRVPTDIETIDNHNQQVKLKNIDGIWHSTYWKGQGPNGSCLQTLTLTESLYHCPKCNILTTKNYPTRSVSVDKVNVLLNNGAKQPYVSACFFCKSCYSC